MPDTDIMLLCITILLYITITVDNRNALSEEKH